MLTTIATVIAGVVLAGVATAGVVATQSDAVPAGYERAQVEQAVTYDAGR